MVARSISGRQWAIPGRSHEGGGEHRVPLSDRALAFLGDVPRDGEYVFPGARAGRPLSNMALWEIMRAMRPGATVHGVRSTFRDWSAEQTSYPHELCEIALAHTVGSKVEAAYRRGDMMEKRRRLMADWSAYCSGPRLRAARSLLSASAQAQ